MIWNLLCIDHPLQTLSGGIFPTVRYFDNCALIRESINSAWTPVSIAGLAYLAAF